MRQYQQQQQQQNYVNGRRRVEEEKERMRQEEEEKEQRLLKELSDKEACPYKVLGITKDATQTDVKKAYRTLSLKYHPDKNPGCHHSKAMFTKLVDAYEILGDADRRILHDEEGFGEYQTRPHNYKSDQGFYSGNSFVIPLNNSEFERQVQCRFTNNPNDDPDTNIQECSPWMVEFYTPWCVHCKHMIPDWKRAASTMDGMETPLGFVKFGAINCENERTLCKQEGVRAYPQIHLYSHDIYGQQHVERLPSHGDRTVEGFTQFAEKGIRLVHESNLQPMDSFLMDRNVTNATSTGLWIILFEDSGSSCQQCDTLKASIRRMSANIRGLSNFGVVDCRTETKICRDQYVVGNPYPVLRMYPYQGSKGTGEILYQADSRGADPHVLLPVIEKVIRMCIANLEVNNQIMNTLHEDEDEDVPLQEEPISQYQYPEPERQVHYVLPAGVRAGGGGGAQYIAGG